MKKATVTEIIPEGSTLTRATGAAIRIGEAVTDGESVTLATPDGSSGALTLSAHGVRLVIRNARLPPAEPPPEPAVEASVVTPRAPVRVTRTGLGGGGPVAVKGDV